ncbi:Serine protease trypsin-like protein, partial [Globisporangium splendens]
MGAVMKNTSVSCLGVGAAQFDTDMNIPFASLEFAPRKAFIDDVTSMWVSSMDSSQFAESESMLVQRGDSGAFNRIDPRANPAGHDRRFWDSESPLVLVASSPGRQDRLAGLVSAGYGCGVVGKPGLCTRVSPIADWTTKHSVGSTADAAASASPSLGDKANSSGDQSANEPSTTTGGIALQSAIKT